MKSKRIFYYDILNISACIGVIALHHNRCVHKFTPSSDWDAALIIEVLFFWAVPIFFMLTGATLMEYRKRYDTKTFFKRRISRTFIPFIIWSIIAGIIQYLVGNIEMPLNIKDIIDLIFNTKILPIYWFFIPLFMLYLSTPIISQLNNVLTIKYIILTAFIFESVIPVLCLLLNIEYNSNFNLPVANGPIIYFLLGYYLSNNEIKQKNEFIIYILAIICLVIRYIMMHHFSYQNNEEWRLLSNYYYFTAVIPACAIFLIGKKILTPSNKKIITITSKISSCSLGIYLIHIFIILALPKLSNVDIYSFTFRIALIPVTYTLSLLIVLLSRKTIIGKYLFP